MADTAVGTINSAEFSKSFQLDSAPSFQVCTGGGVGGLSGTYFSRFRTRCNRDFEVASRWGRGKYMGKPLEKDLKSLFLPPAARLELSMFSPRHHSHVSHQNPCSSRSRIARGCHFSPEVLKRDLDANAGQQEDNMKSIQARHSQKRMQITTATNGNYYIITKASTAKKTRKLNSGSPVLGY